MSAGVWQRLMWQECGKSWCGRSVSTSSSGGEEVLVSAGVAEAGVAEV